MSFTLPQSAPQYTHDTMQRCERLIKRGIWAGLEPAHLRRWIQNFEGDLERYFAACLLDALIFRSHAQTLALAKHLFQRSLPDRLRVRNIHLTPRHGWLPCLQTPPDLDGPPVRLVPVLKPEDTPGKSGEVIARLLRRYLRVHEDWIIHPSQLTDPTTHHMSHLVFIDDIAGTGTQFSEFFDDWGFGHSQSHLLYTPFVAHEQAFTHIETNYPVTLAAAEFLPSNIGIFSSSNPYFDDGDNTADDARSFYYDLLDKFEIEVSGSDRRGFGHLELPYVFEHAAPDNGILLYWWPNSSSFSPLFAR